MWRVFTSFIAVAIGGVIILTLIREHRGRDRTPTDGGERGQAGHA
jgi:hypothetical protein